MPSEHDRPMPIRALLFDLDQTLYDRRATVRRWLADECRQSGLRPAAATTFIDEVLALEQNGYGDREAALARIDQGLGWNLVDSAVIRERFAAGLLANLPAIAEHLALLRRLAPRYRIGILTNGRATMQGAKIERLGLAAIADPCLSSGALGVAKPAAGAYRAACAHWRLPPEQVLMIGDHPVNDIDGARRAGLRTCWIADRRFDSLLQFLHAAINGAVDRL